jgi:hypothetical protein
MCVKKFLETSSFKILFYINILLLLLYYNSFFFTQQKKKKDYFIVSASTNSMGITIFQREENIFFCAKFMKSESIKILVAKNFKISFFLTKLRFVESYYI